MPDRPSVTDEHLPALYRVADRASLEAQQGYLGLVRADLLLMVLAAITTSGAVSSPNLRAFLAIAGAIALVASLVITSLVLQKGLNKQWFTARAVAESVKSIAWRYMMGAKPYANTLTLQQVDELFCRELESILRERRAIGGALGGSDASGEQITGRMRTVRNLDLVARRQIYLEDRIKDQRKWYGGKSSTNARLSSWWLGAIAAVQLAGAGAAICLVRWPELEFNLASILVAVATAFLAWLQVKQHLDLSQSYALAAHELGLIESRVLHAQSEAVFAKFVADSEAAISREHTMWIARRDIVT